MQEGAGIAAGFEVYRGSSASQLRGASSSGSGGTPNTLGFVHRSLALVDEHAAKLLIAERAQGYTALDFITKTRLTVQEQNSANKVTKQGNKNQRQIVRQHNLTIGVLGEWWCGARMPSKVHDFEESEVLDTAFSLSSYEVFYATLLGALHAAQNQQDDLDLTLRSWANMDWHTDQSDSSGGINQESFEDSVFELADYCCQQPLEVVPVVTFLRKLFTLVFGEAKWYAQWVAKQSSRSSWEAGEGVAAEIERAEAARASRDATEHVGLEAGEQAKREAGGQAKRDHLSAPLSRRAAHRRHSITEMGASPTKVRQTHSICMARCILHTHSICMALLDVITILLPSIPRVILAAVAAAVAAASTVGVWLLGTVL
jgi:hypothetical protein